MLLLKRTTALCLGILVCLTVGTLRPASSAPERVRLWEEDLVLPTYLAGEPSVFPIFYNGRAYQGAQGKVYPYAFLDELTDERRHVAYKAVYLENRYVKLCVLPELGGRIFSAQDKSNGYDLFYRQTVVKPALIGMLGAWLSGGVEWNIPHHHRATSFMPVDYTLKENADGSKTVWIGELELRHRMAWAIGLTLHPESSRIQTTVRIVNRTPFAHSLLYWANVAVHTNEDYQVIFPPGTEYATYHGKNQFTHWPVAREPYNRVDYSAGVDISWWKNHPAPSSFFAWNHEDDFLAGYDHGKKAGVLHVADHHVMPGKKFWTWGTAAQGRRWDTILSDEDGPYLELMVGAYSDNQPDYSWIEPFETRSFTHCWYPIRELGGVKAANRDAALNLDVAGSMARVGVNVSSPLKNAEVLLWSAARQVLHKKLDLAPDKPFFTEVDLAEGMRPEDLRLVLKSGGRVVLSFAPETPEGGGMPRTVEPPRMPEEVGTIEELYLAGLRLEQFHNPTRDPLVYYEEALSRDPEDARVNTRLGILSLKRGKSGEAEAFLKRAAERLGGNHTRPKDCEPYYYLGLALKDQGKAAEAIDAMERAAWDRSWRAAACLVLAEMACARGEYDEALEYLDRTAPEAAAAPAGGHQLRAAVLRHLGRLEEAEEAAVSARHFNPLDFRAANEAVLVRRGVGDEKGADRELDHLVRLMRDDPQSYLELAADYLRCGLYLEARDVLRRLEQGKRGAHPLVLYYLGHLEQKAGGEDGTARRFVERAAMSSPDRCFPFRRETAAVLESVLEENPGDSRAFYYLGTCLFETQPEKAIEKWERSRELGEEYFMLFRNLGLAYARVRNDGAKAVSQLEEALERERGQARLFFEMDMMSEAAGESPENRLALLENNHATVKKRDDALTQEIKLLVQTGRYGRAIELMSGHHFHVWEGGGQIHSYFVHTHLLRGLSSYKKGDYEGALEDFKRAGEYPQNLEVGEPFHGGRKARIRYFEGTALEALERMDEAEEAYADSAGREPGWSELSFYRGMALSRLGRGEEAAEVFQGLSVFAGRRLGEAPAVDFFTKFGERQSAAARRARSFYLQGLAELGLGDKAAARNALEQAVSLDTGLFWARYYLDTLR